MCNKVFDIFFIGSFFYLSIFKKFLERRRGVRFGDLFLVVNVYRIRWYFKFKFINLFL